MAKSSKFFPMFAAGAVLALCYSLPAANAQIVRAPLSEGFARTSSISMSIDEMLGTSKERALDEPILGPGYPALWIAEVQYKPIRLVRLDLPDPKTGQMRKELIRYMVYRAIRRDYTELAGKDKAELERKLSDPELDPSNALDAESTMPLQMPRFLLETQTKDGMVTNSYLDEVSVKVQNAVFQREMGRRGKDLKLMNSIEGIAEIGEPVAKDDPDALLKAVYGVAVWRNVDPKADFMSVTMSGFCNAYRITGTGDARIVEEKVIVQKFARPGDEFLQDESELRFIDNADTDGDGLIDARYPMWTYRAKEVDLKIPNLDSVLRNIRSTSVSAPEN
jgi:hypothetical protein